MKKYFFRILICTVAILGIASFLIENPAHSADAQESAYNRVLRTGELRCGYVNWNPYFITDPNNPKHRTGVNVEITEAIGRILDLKIVWAEEVGWGNLAEGLHTGRYDAVCTSIWPDGPKIKNLALSDAMFYDTLYVYARADDKRFTNMQSLNKADVKVAAVEGGPSYEIAHNAFPAGTITAISPNAPTADFFLTVTTKKADILVTSPSEFKAFDDSNPGQLKRIANIPPVRLMPMLMSFGPENDALRNRINFALQLMIDNGDMDKIVKKYSDDYVLRVPQHGLKK